MKRQIKEAVFELIEQPLTEYGYEPAEVLVSEYKNNVTVRVFLYGKDGVTLEECAHLSRLIGGILDRAELFNGGYALEVSSPGLDRPLKTIRDYQYRIGETIKIEFVDKTRKGFKAQIMATGNGSVQLSNEQGSVTIDLADIKGAKIVF